MNTESKFGPAAQTPEQRAHILRQLLEATPHLKAQATTSTHQLFDRYVAGELSWGEVRQALDTNR
jgi:hypothetical protein